MQLKQGTLLQKGKYKIERCLGQGSFGITYLAKMKFTISGGIGKTLTWVDVAIKEFFMKDFNSRQSDGALNKTSPNTIVEKYKKDFKKEAANLSMMEHPGIVDILDTFEENNTCYLVMGYIDGQSLDTYIAEKGVIPENEALLYIEKIADALHYMHCQRMLHLDLKPKNIMCNKENDTFIIDFGLSKQYDENDEPESSTTLGQGTQGYAPIEQGVPHSAHDFPVTIDVYALGATFYKILTGKTPPYAASIFSTPEILVRELKTHNANRNLTSTIIKAMSPRKEDRYKSVADFMKSLGLTVHDYPKVIKEPEVTVVEETYNSSQELQTEREKVTYRKKYGNIFKNIIDSFDISLEYTRKKISYFIAMTPYKAFAFIVSLIVLFYGTYRVARLVDWKRLPILNFSSFKVSNMSFDIMSKIDSIDKYDVVYLKDNKMLHFTYSGEVTADSLPNGRGAAEFDNGTMYEGIFVNGVCHDTAAVFSFPDGSSFKGSVDNYFCVDGRLTKKDGSYFIGHFVKNNPDNNNGTFYFEDGRKKEEVQNLSWDISSNKNIPLEDMKLLKAFNMTRYSYSGTTADGIPHGYGIAKFGNGTYKGKFVNGVGVDEHAEFSNVADHSEFKGKIVNFIYIKGSLNQNGYHYIGDFINGYPKEN